MANINLYSYKHEIGILYLTYVSTCLHHYPAIAIEDAVRFDSNYLNNSDKVLNY